MHQKQPPAKMAVASPAAGGDACWVALPDQAAVIPRERATPVPKIIDLMFIVVSPVLA
jgi:hypothetical protein